VSPLEQSSYTAIKDENKETAVDRPLVGADYKMDTRGYCVGFADLLLAMIPFASQNYTNWNDFFRVLSCLANLGSVEKAYLNKRDLIPKLIDVYLGPKSPHPELNLVASSSSSGLRTRMKNPDCTWLFKFLSVIAGNSLSNVSELGQEMLTCTEFLEAFLIEGTRFKSSLGVNYIAMELSKDVKMSAKISAIIGNGMSNRAHDQCRPYFRVINAILGMEDAYQAERVDVFMRMLVAVLNAQSGYWKVVDFCVDHIIRLAKKNVVARQWLADNSEHVDFMINWFRSYPTPPTGIISIEGGEMVLDRMRLQPGTATLLYHQHDFMYTQSSQKHPYHLPVVDKVNALNAIKGQGELDMNNAADSDQELQDRKLEVKDFIDVLDEQNNWLKAQVVAVRPGGVVRITYCGFKDTYDCNIDMASTRIAPLHKFSVPKTKERRGV